MKEEILEKLNKHDLVIGIDEVGRGPIAGPVTVCAFGVQKKYFKEVFERLLGITDSKKLTEKKREFFVNIIKELKMTKKVFVIISSVSAKKIDEVGISAALRAALNSTVRKITKDFQNPYIYLDGSLFAQEKYLQETIIKGDSKNWLIGAASVVAKVSRDLQMVKLSNKYKDYGFERHKGYGTKLHYEMINKYGVCDIHRKTWVKIINL